MRRFLLLSLVLLHALQPTATPQALQKGDVTLGAGANRGYRSHALSRGNAVTGEATYSLSDQFYLHGSGSRFSGSLGDSRTRASNVHHLVEMALGIQFRLQQSMSPFLDAGLSGLWGDGTEKYETAGGPRSNQLEFWQVSARFGGGLRFVRKPATPWGFSVYYRLLVPVHNFESSAFPLVHLRTRGVHDRAGATFFLRF